MAPISPSDPEPGYTFIADGVIIGRSRALEYESVIAPGDYRLTLIDWDPVKPPETETDWPAAMVGSLQPGIDAANRLRQELVEKGWSYEAAEEVAGHMLKNIVRNAFKGAT